MPPFPLLAAFLLICCTGNSRTDARPPGQTAYAPPAVQGTLTFAWYNLENAFDPADDTTRAGDDEFTPEGKNNWTQARLERKLEGVARAIKAIDELKGPDITGLCEIENRNVLEQLVNTFLPKAQYAIIHAESPDERGIDVAILYKPSSVTLAGFVMHRVDLGPGARPTRDIMEATFRRDGRTFTVLANHWPSKSGGQEESAPRRQAAAAVAAGIVDSLTRLNPNADIVLMGDLNDTPDSKPVWETLDARPWDGQVKFAHRLINTAMANTPADTIGTYYYQKHWETIDQIMLSGSGALDTMGLVMTEARQTIFCPAFLRDRKYKYDSTAHPPYRTYRGPVYIGGISDHFPVLLHVGWNGK